MKKVIFAILVIVTIYSCGGEKQPEVKLTAINNAALISSMSDNEDYAKYVADFSNHLCQCIEIGPSKINLMALPAKYKSCSKDYMVSNPSSTSRLIDQLRKKNNLVGGDQEVGSRIEEILVQKANSLLAKKCEFFISEFANMKSMMMNQLEVTAENIDIKISQLTNEIKNVSQPAEFANLYTVIGILYEEQGQNEMAGKYYLSGANLGAANSNVCSILLEMME